MAIGAGRMNRLSKRPQTPQAISTAQCHRKGVPHFSLSYSRMSFNHHWLTYFIIQLPTLFIFFNFGQFHITFPAYTTLRPKGAMSRRARAIARSVYAVLGEVDLLKIIRDNLLKNHSSINKYQCNTIILANCF